MNEIDWTSFKRRISIKSDPSSLFNAWTSQDELEEWFLRDAEFFSNGKAKDRFEEIQLGDTYKWTWHGSDNVAEGVILETNQSDFLKFTFLGCVVSVTIKVEEGMPMIELIQSEIGVDDASKLSYYVGCTRGWTFYLTNLKSILEGGIDLRNRNSQLIDVINT